MIDPGPKATPEQWRRASKEAATLVYRIHPFNLPYAAKHIRANRPSDEATAALAVIAHDIFSSGAQSHRGKSRKP